MSTQHEVAESWEDADADPTKELMEKMEKVKILQRKEEKKEAFFEKVKAEENGAIIPKLKAEEGTGPVEEPKRVFLRRPKDGFAAETVAESSPPSATGSESAAHSRGRSHHKKDSKKEEPKQTFEERQAAYQAARDRILGSEYKPDNQEIKEIKFVDRSKSPETLKMTEQNMVEHYGEELSRELMHQPEPLVPPPPAAGETSHVIVNPDFSFQQPPPNFIPPQEATEFSAPPGFQQRPTQGYQQQQQYIDAPQSYYGVGQMPMHFSSQGQFQQFVPQEATPVTSASQNSALEAQNEQQQQPVYYGYQPPQHQQQQQQQQQQMNYNYNYNLPNMSYPPPNFQQQNMQSHQNQQQMYQMPQQHPQLMNQQFPMVQKGPGGRGGVGPSRGGRGGGSGGMGRGGPPNQNQQMVMMYGMMHIGRPMPQMYPNGHHQPPQQNPPNNGQMYSGVRNGMPPQNQQRQFLPNQQNGPFVANQGRKTNKNGKNGVRSEEAPFQMRMQMSTSVNPIPFGCPPRYVNSYREQQQSNNGAGLLGPHPFMSAGPQWKNPQRPQQ